MRIPLWTVLFSRCGAGGWIIKTKEFFEDKTEAKHFYDHCHDVGAVPTLRPFHVGADIDDMGCIQKKSNTDIVVQRIRVTLTVDYLIESSRPLDEIVEEWFLEYPKREGGSFGYHAARDQSEIGGSKRYIRHKVIRNERRSYKRDSDDLSKI